MLDHAFILEDLEQDLVLEFDEMLNEIKTIKAESEEKIAKAEEKAKYMFAKELLKQDVPVDKVKLGFKLTDEQITVLLKQIDDEKQKRD